MPNGYRCLWIMAESDWTVFSTYQAKNLSDVTVARAAQTRDVEVVPLSVYSRKGLAREGLQLGFAAVDPPELRRGVRELERVLTTLT